MRSAPLRLVLRDPAKLSETVRDRVEVVEGSHGDPAVADRALAGVDTVFWLASPTPTQTLEETYFDFTRPAAEAVRRAEAGVSASVRPADRPGPSLRPETLSS